MSAASGPVQIHRPQRAGRQEQRYAHTEQRAVQPELGVSLLRRGIREGCGGVVVMEDAAVENQCSAEQGADHSRHRCRETHDSYHQNGDLSLHCVIQQITV